ncbi:enoyl-CoA hydratase/carnithine racemase [Polaromonas sp. CF318]|uniref:enoyl-CoA hydratase/isomerase family protein n=1 Tax=Polaromonas sp. CF318 TaxID=1144318 RepID=UPI000270F1B1|nr:enoyl-CoA hydratase-related protein [Polaromonas sp. CF318]EJL91307.1 enoyl-CoA hydratase/carnithine racemase [Polaromonas sp. CF318]
MTSPKLLIEVADGIMALSLNRPDKLNAIDNELARALLAALEQAARDDGVRVLLLRGKGRAFCAGRDVGAPPTEDDLVLVQAVAKALVCLPKPVIAAVHGWTVGAGFEWMLNADIVVAAESARFKLPEASLGVFVTGGLTATLPAYAGVARAKALMLLGEAFSPVQAQAWGLVWKVVPDPELESVSRQAGATLAALLPDVAARYKRVLNEIGLRHFDEAITLENDAQRALGGRAQA